MALIILDISDGQVKSLDILAFTRNITREQIASNLLSSSISRERIKSQSRLILDRARVIENNEEIKTQVDTLITKS